MQQPTTQSSTVAPKKRRSMGKKTKYGTACVVCKEDHKACDGGRPCSRCVSLGIASSCQSISRRKNKEESPVSGGFVFCLEEIAASKSRSPPTSQPVCNTPPQQQQPPTSSPTYSANTYNFHYTSPSNNFSYTHSAYQNGQPTQTPPTFSNRPPKRTKTASETYQQVGAPRPAASPSPVDDLLLLEFSRPPGVALPTVPSVMQSLDSPAMEFEELEKDEALERLSQQQIELLQQQLLIEKERQAKLQKKLEIRRAQLQRPLPPQQLMPLQQQQQYIYLDQLSQQESSTQVMVPEDFKQEFQLLQPLGQPQPTPSSAPGKKRKAAEIADSNAFRYLLKDDEELSGSSSSGSEEDFDVSPDSDLDAEWFSDFFPVPLDVALDRKRFAPCWYAPFIIKDCTKPWSVLKPHVLEDGTRTAACVAEEILGLNRHRVYADDEESKLINQRTFVGRTRRVVKPGVVSSPIVRVHLRIKGARGTVLDAIVSKQFFYDEKGRVSFFVMVIESTAVPPFKRRREALPPPSLVELK